MYLWLLKEYDKISTTIILNAQVIWEIFWLKRASLVTQILKNPPVMQETKVQWLSQADSLEKEMATHSSFLAWRIPWTEEPGRLTVHGVAESDMTDWLSFSLGSKNRVWNRSTKLLNRKRWEWHYFLASDWTSLSYC